MLSRSFLVLFVIICAALTAVGIEQMWAGTIGQYPARLLGVALVSIAAVVGFNIKIRGS